MVAKVLFWYFVCLIPYSRAQLEFWQAWNGIAVGGTLA